MVKKETSAGLTVPGNMQPGHGSPLLPGCRVHSTMATALTHLSARWPWAPWGSCLALEEGRKRKVSGASSHPVPGRLLQGRAGIAPAWPQPPQPAYLLALGARHAAVPLQSEAEESFREPSSLHAILPLPQMLPQSPSGPSPESHLRPLGSDSNTQA